MKDLLFSETGLNLAVWAFGLAWAALKGSQWWKESVAAKHAKAVEAVEAGVTFAYANYVRKTKEASTTGSLTPVEQDRARGIAKEAATAFGQKNGIDVQKTLGAEFVDLYLEKAVQAAKGKA